MKIVTTRIHPTLPVFRLETREWHVLYTPPGHLAVVEPAVAHIIQSAWNTGTTSNDPTAQHVAEWLQTQAEQTSEKWQQWIQSPFAPECLTVYLSNQCNSACSYCYASPARQRGGKN
jgi:hypothetical protein